MAGTSQVWRLDRAQRFPVQVTGGKDATAIAGMFVNPDTGKRQKFLFGKATGSLSREYYEYDVSTRTT